MSMGLVVEKCGMSRLFKEDGSSVPVTILKVMPTFVTQVKTSQTDGYASIQVTTGEKKASRVIKPEAGHFKKAGVKPGLGAWEFRLDSDSDAQKYTLGEQIKLENVISEGLKVKIVGKSKGKGYAGTVKRHNFRTQDASHGNSISHRVPGSIGQNQTPGRVFKGKKMSGQMGNVNAAVLNQEVVKVDLDKQLIMVKGGVPGAPGGLVLIHPMVNVSGDK
jgi:large subunit ribosomal protein L3